MRGGSGHWVPFFFIDPKAKLTCLMNIFRAHGCGCWQCAMAGVVLRPVRRPRWRPAFRVFGSTSRPSFLERFASRQKITKLPGMSFKKCTQPEYVAKMCAYGIHPAHPSVFSSSSVVFTSPASQKAQIVEPRVAVAPLDAIPSSPRFPFVAGEKHAPTAVGCEIPRVRNTT